MSFEISDGFYNHLQNVFVSFEISDGFYNHLQNVFVSFEISDGFYNHLQNTFRLLNEFEESRTFIESLLADLNLIF